MIIRLFAAARELGNRKPGVVDLVVGMLGTAAGLFLLNRYHAGVVDRLGEITEEYDDLASQRSRAMEEHNRLVSSINELARRHDVVSRRLRTTEQDLERALGELEGARVLQRRQEPGTEPMHVSVHDPAAAPAPDPA